MAEQYDIIMLTVTAIHKLVSQYVLHKNKSKQHIAVKFQGGLGNNNTYLTQT